MDNYIALVGNLSEGYSAYGPYENIEDAFDDMKNEECWIMHLNPRIRKVAQITSIEEYKNNRQDTLPDFPDESA